MRLLPVGPLEVRRPMVCVWSRSWLADYKLDTAVAGWQCGGVHYLSTSRGLGSRPAGPYNTQVFLHDSNVPHLKRALVHPHLTLILRNCKDLRAFFLLSAGIGEKKRCKYYILNVWYSSCWCVWGSAYTHCAELMPCTVYYWILLQPISLYNSFILLVFKKLKSHLSHALGTPAFL